MHFISIVSTQGGNIFHHVSVIKQTKWKAVHVERPTGPVDSAQALV